MVMLDYILLGLLLLWTLLGFKKGFLQALGSLVGFAFAIIIASRTYPYLAHWFGDTNFANIIAFILIFGIVIKLIGLIFWVLSKIFQIITVLPLISTFDRFLGAILGAVTGIFILAIILHVLMKYPLNAWIILEMKHSAVSAVLWKIGDIFMPLFPEVLRKVKMML